MDLQFEPGESVLVTTPAEPKSSEPSKAFLGTSKREQKKVMSKEYHDGSRHQYYTSIKGKPILYVQTFYEDARCMKLDKVLDHDLLDKKLGFSFGNNLHLVDVQTATILFIYEAYDLKNWIEVQCVRRDRKLIVRERGDGTDLTELALDDGFVKYATNLLTDYPTISDTGANCKFPCIYIPDRKHFVSGLASCTRFLFKYSSAMLHTWSQNGHMTNKLKPLLGFREACLQACAESSVFTKFCEEDIPVRMVKSLSTSLKQLADDREDGEAQGSIPIPEDLLRFEYHLAQPPKVHNVSKKIREQKNVAVKSDKRKVRETGERKKKETETKETEERKVKETEKKDEERKKKEVMETEEKTQTEPEEVEERKEEAMETEERKGKRNDEGKEKETEEQSKNAGEQQEKVAEERKEENGEEAKKETEERKEKEAEERKEEKTEKQKEDTKDVEIEHTYVEGPAMTLADLILYPTVTMVLKEVFTKTTIQEHLPRVCAWRKRVKVAMRKPPLTGRFNLVTKYRHFGYPNLPVDGHLPDGDIRKETLYQRDMVRYIGSKNKYTAPIETNQAIKIFSAPNNIMEYCTNEELNLGPLIDWADYPNSVSPGVSGGLPKNRQKRKNAQVANMIQMIQFVYEMTAVTRTEEDTTPIRIADFCSGCGLLGIAVAWMFEDCEVYLIDNKEESLRRAQKRVEELGLKNVTIFQCNLTNFTGQFEIGCALHACGSSTDLVIQQSYRCDFAASFVISPCCYGKMKPNSLVTYPQSYAFEDAEEDHPYNKRKNYYRILAHSADHCTSGRSEQGRLAMRLIDTDRCRGREEVGYKTWLKKMDPPDASPENHILVGIWDGLKTE